MELLVSFLNLDDLLNYISTSMSNILAYQDEPTRQEKEMEELSRLSDALPAKLHLHSISVADQLFDYLLQNKPSIYHHRLLTLCLNLMKVEDRLHRIKCIILLIVNNEQTAQSCELLCKLLSTIQISASMPLNIDWKHLESTLVYQHDPKFLTHVWHFLSKYYQTDLEQILLHTLPRIKTNDELLLSLLIALQSIRVFVSMSSFWYLIQRSLGDSKSNNDRTRKCGLYLFRQILANDEYKHIEIREEKFSRLVILIDEKAKQFWVDFIILYEAFEDGIDHLIKPLLTKFDRLLSFSLEHGSSPFFVFKLNINFLCL